MPITIVMGTGQDIKIVWHSSAVTLSLCTELSQGWTPLVSVPVTTKGKIQAPIAETLRTSGKGEELEKARKGDVLFSIKKEYDGSAAITTYLPLKDIHFQFGKDAPLDPEELRKNVGAIAAKLRMMIDGTYRCIRWQEMKPVIYVVGHTDTVGSAKTNQGLSEKRARAIALATKDELDNPGVQVCYVGVGEQEAGTTDNVPSPEARRAEVMVTSEGNPISTKWSCLKAGRKKP